MARALLVHSLLVSVLLVSTAVGIAVSDTPFQTLFEPDSRVRCYRIPSLVTAPNGDLLAVADQRVPNCNDLNRNDNIELALRRSSDQGRTWEPVDTIVKFPKGASASDPSMVVDTKTKTVFLMYNFMNHSAPHPQYYFHLIESQDNGRTWSPYRDITSQIIPPRMAKEFIFVTSGRAFYDPVTEQIVHNVVNVNTRSVIPFGSSDHGKTWWYRDVDLRPADESKSVILHQDENSGVNGTWIINSRTHLRHRIFYTSKDNGYTWNKTEMKTLVDPNCNAGFITYTPGESRSKNMGGDKKEALIFTNAFNPSRRVNVSVHTSWDGGNTWSAGLVLDQGGSWYSSPTIIDNNFLGVLYEREEKGKASIVFTQVPLKEIL